MPYDALTAATEELAPARATTNFFDPEQGRNVISRYAGARIAAEGAAAIAEGSAAIADASSRLNKSRIDRAEARRQAVQFDRDEIDYQEKSDYKAQRGQFLSDIAAIDPNADDYDEQISGILQDLPMEVREDDALQAMLTHKNRIADSVRTEREMQARREEQFNDRAAIEKLRYENDPKLAALTPEERNSFIDPATREFDVYGARNLAYEKTREDKKTDSKEIAAERAKASADKAAELDRRKAVMEFGVADQGAFPSQLGSFLTTHPKFDPDNIDTTNPKEIEELKNYNAAATYEKKKLESEMASALNYEKDAYVKKGGDNLSDTQKMKREDLWNLAREMAGNAAPAEEGRAAGDDAEPRDFGDRYADTTVEDLTGLRNGIYPSLKRARDAGDLEESRRLMRQIKGLEVEILKKKNAGAETPAAPKPLTPEARADIMERAGGDPVKAKQIAIEEGY